MFALVTAVLVVTLSAGVVRADEPDLLVELHLDSHQLVIGEPLSGEVSILNQSNTAQVLRIPGGRLFGWLSIDINGKELPFYPGDKARRYGSEAGPGCTVGIEPGEYKRDLVFCLTRGGVGVSAGHSIKREPADFVFNETGTFSVVARMLVGIGAEGEYSYLRSDTLFVEVGPPAPGWECYRDLLDYPSVVRPFKICLPSWVQAYEESDCLQGYRRVVAKVIAYLYGARLNHLIYRGEADPHRSPQFVLSEIRGGLVGNESLMARKCRIAMLYRYDQLFSESCYDEYEPIEGVEAYFWSFVAYCDVPPEHRTMWY